MQKEYEIEKRFSESVTSVTWMKRKYTKYSEIGQSNKKKSKTLVMSEFEITSAMHYGPMGAEVTVP